MPFPNVRISGQEKSDKLWTAAIDENGNSKADLLSTRVQNLELEQQRLTERLASLQVSVGSIPQGEPK